MSDKQTASIGLFEKLYASFSGSHATPVWVEVARAVDVSVNMGKGEADVSSRASGGFRKTRGTLKEWEFTFGYRYKKKGKGAADSVFANLKTHYMNGDPVELAAMDGDINAANAAGPRAMCELFSKNHSAALEAGHDVEFTAKPTDFEEGGNEIAPDWYET